MQHKTTAVVSWDDLLNFGQTYEYFADLLQEAVAEEFDVEAHEVLVTEYGFLHVISPGEVAVEIEYELDVFDDDDDVVYTLTPKGKLVTDLLQEGLDYETASRIAGAAFPDSGEVVGS